MEKFLIIIVYRFWLGHKIKNRIFLQRVCFKSFTHKKFSRLQKSKNKLLQEYEKIFDHYIVSLFRYDIK